MKLFLGSRHITMYICTILKQTKMTQVTINNEKLQSLNGQLAYVNEALKQEDIKQWELREFNEVKKATELEITEIKALINRIKAVA